MILNWENGAKRRTGNRLHFYSGSTFRLCELWYWKGLFHREFTAVGEKRKSTWVSECWSLVPQTDSYTAICSINRRIFLSQAHSAIKGSLWRCFYTRNSKSKGSFPLNSRKKVVLKRGDLNATFFYFFVWNNYRWAAANNLFCQRLRKGHHNRW
jgi:uncharacterized membrane protein